MRSDLSELVFILDRSGSMSGLELDTIGGFNSMIQKQRAEAGDAVVTTVLFDDRMEVLHNHQNIGEVPVLTEREYYARGTTALLDAVGSTIERTRNRQKELKEEYVPAHTIFVITTDGLENASRRFTFDQIRHMVEECQAEYGWEFLFIGANMDAIASAASIGIKADYAATQCHDAEGTRLTYGAMGDALGFIRMGIRPTGWKAEIERDYAERGPKGGTRHRRR